MRCDATAGVTVNDGRCKCNRVLSQLDPSKMQDAALTGVH